MADTGVCKMTDQIVLEFSNMLWAYKAVAKQTNVAGGALAMNFTVQERFVLLYGQVGPDDYSASKNVNVNLYDATGGVIVIPMQNVEGLDDQRMAFPSRETDPVIKPMEFGNRMVIGSGEVIKISTATLVQNEELTVTMRGLIGSVPPVVSLGVIGTPTITVEYNKVI